MIKINKLPEPNILSTEKEKWTEELLDTISSGSNIPNSTYNKYNNKEVKDILKVECRNKCMYCESVVNHVTYEHIEHYRPKAKTKYPELTYDWNNLGLSCPICNMNKGDKFDEDLQFVNPYIDEPSNYFVAIGNMVYAKPGNKRADLTNRIIELNRPELIETRKERLISIERLINRYVAEGNTILKQAILDEIHIELSEDKPYSMCAKSLFALLI